MTDQERGTFDPHKHVTNVGGNPYLDVDARVRWLRSEHPDASIETEMYSFNAQGEKEAIIRASIVLPTGASATAYGSETFGDFRDYIEKAETKAIGRALGFLGYGTPEDAVAPPKGQQQRQAPPQQLRPQQQNGNRPPQGQQPQQRQAPQQGQQQGAGLPPTPRQNDMIADVSLKLGLADTDLDRWLQANCGGVTIEQMDRAQASSLIGWLQAIQRGEASPLQAQAQGAPSGQSAAAYAASCQWEVPERMWVDRILEAKTVRQLDAILGHLPRDQYGALLVQFTKLVDLRKAEVAG